MAEPKALFVVVPWLKMRKIWIVLITTWEACQELAAAMFMMEVFNKIS